MPGEPSRAGVDPYRKLIERERGNNVVAVKSGSKEFKTTGAPADRADEEQRSARHSQQGHASHSGLIALLLPAGMSPAGVVTVVAA